MSIRLKKVQWNYSGDGTLWRCVIAGWWYECWQPRLDTAKWGAAGTNGRVFDAPTLAAAKSACEQHALERIREAVEVDADHIPDATEMVNGWQPISTAPRDGTMILICGGRYQSDDCAHGMSIGDRAIATRFVQRLNSGDSPWVDLSDPTRTCSIQDPSHWMPLPKPPKGGGES